MCFYIEDDLAQYLLDKHLDIGVYSEELGHITPKEVVVTHSYKNNANYFCTDLVGSLYIDAIFIFGSKRNLPFRIF